MVPDTLEIAASGPLRGEIDVPGDKSISHRSLLLNALARGEARVRGLLPSEDVHATLAAVRAMGVTVEEGDEIVVRATGALAEPGDVLDCGNSGTSIRLLSGVVAAEPMFTVLSGDASLRRRPMRRVLDPLRAMGARVDGRGGGDRAPIAVRGGELRPLDHDLAIASAQVKSALLLAGRRVGVRVREPARSRDHTERMLVGMGAPLREEGGWIVLDPCGDLRAIDVDVPGDPSSAAFWLVAASLVPGSEILLRRVGVNPTRSGVIDALRLMGADIRVEPVAQAGAEPVADLVVRHAPLRGARIDGELALRSLDELVVLGVAAGFAEGETMIADAAELRVKESDRIAEVAIGLRSLGIEVEERPDGMVIQGGRPRGPATVHARGDHRIAMAFAVAACAAGPIRVEGAATIATSYPRFLEHLEALGGHHHRG
ncbi:MAG TPA: 3-phosphoshikimate 1-carboxyvinyltransferase [Myxococcota bacterium]|nr:3-phosphoshikimate 1-carboxyvinyltransferase [Myxococcota bacterium]